MLLLVLVTLLAQSSGKQEVVGSIPGRVQMFSDYVVDNRLACVIEYFKNVGHVV